METASGAGWFARETWGYSVPVIDPGVIVRPSQFSLAPAAVAGNLFWAILIALVMGTSGVVISRLAASDEQRVKQILRRLPFQAVLTAGILWLLQVLVPDAFAQAMEGASAAPLSLWMIPASALAFFLVVGTSNFLFNNLLSAEGDKVFGTASVSNKYWFILLLIVGYGIVGAHINPEFSLLSGTQLGILLVAAFAIILSVCCKDLALYGLARFWKLPGWFRANIGGFAIAVVCIVLSRTFALNPGYIYGVPVGLLIAGGFTREREGFFEFLGMLWILILALAAWILGSVLGGYPVPLDLVNLLFVILAEDAFFELLPLPYLAGGTIFRWKKPVWFALFVTAVFFLFHTLFNPQGTVTSLAESPPTATAVMLLGCYAVGVFLLWAYVVWRRKK